MTGPFIAALSVLLLHSSIDALDLGFRPERSFFPSVVLPGHEEVATDTWKNGNLEVLSPGRAEEGSEQVVACTIPEDQTIQSCQFRLPTGVLNEKSN